MTLEKTLARVLSKLEHGLDRARFSLMNVIGVRKPLRIQSYIGHGNTEKLFLRGRVLLENKVREPTRQDGVWTNLKNMYRRFESDEIPFATVRVSRGETAVTVECDDEGFFQAVLELDEGVPQGQFWQQVRVEVVKTPVDSLDTSGVATDASVIVPPADAEFAVVSDLDDTVMKTDVLNLLKMLRNTIFRNAYTRLPFDGVAAFYRALHNGTQATNNPLFYVSSSPWNLYDMIIDFYRIQNIPMGPVFLRDIGLTRHALGGEGHMGHKLAYIEKLLTRYPALPFILIGDSGQKDVSVYEEAVRRNPGRIQTIYIRDVNRDTARRKKIQAAAERVQAMGCELLLVQDTYEAAQHAAQRGYINEEALEQVRMEKQRDSA